MVVRLNYPLVYGFRRGGAAALAVGVHRDRNLTREFIDGSGSATEHIA